MGWREREWAKFTDDEWRRLVGPRTDPLRTTTTLDGSGYVSTPGEATARRPYGVTAVTLGAALVTLLATSLGLLAHLRLKLHVPSHAPAPANVLNVRWRPSDLAPAAAGGEICLATPTDGRVCATYAAGERPADALRARLEANGITPGS